MNKINFGDRLINFFRSRQFVLYVALFSVLWLTPNTYYVYVSFSAFESPYKELAGAGVALIVAASIMIYTIRKSEKIAYYYSLFEMSISAYYYIQIIGWDWALIPALSFTVMLPISVKGYTKEIDEDLGNEQEPVDIEKLTEEFAKAYKVPYDLVKPYSEEKREPYTDPEGYWGKRKEHWEQKKKEDFGDIVANPPEEFKSIAVPNLPKVSEYKAEATNFGKPLEPTERIITEDDPSLDLDKNSILGQESNTYRIATPEVKPFNPFDSI